MIRGAHSDHILWANCAFIKLTICRIIPFALIYSVDIVFFIFFAIKLMMMMMIEHQNNSMHSAKH